MNLHKLYPLAGYFDKDTDAASTSAADKEAADKEAADKEAADKEAADKAAAGGSDDDGEGGEKAGATVPRARLDAATRKFREREAELKAEIEKLTRSSASDATNQNIDAIEKTIVELEAKHKAALDDGKSETATALLREIRIRERQISDLRAENLSDRARALAVEQVKTDLLISRLEEQFPQINPDSDEYDQTVVDEVLFLRQSFEARGLASSEALSRAMKYVFADKPPPAAGSDDKKGLGAGRAADRKTAAVDKALAAAGKTPPTTSAAGHDSDTRGMPKVSEMTEEEFAALPEATRARLRGDFRTA